MAYFNFRRLIEKYSTDFAVDIPTEGYYNDAGDWEKGEPTRKTIRGAIINHRESKIFRSEGKLTGQDKALYMLMPLENSLHGAEIIAGDKIYAIGDLLENGRFTGVWAYTLKYVSAFKGERPDYDLTEEYDELADRLDGTLTREEEPTPEPPQTDDAEELEKRLDGV